MMNFACRVDMKNMTYEISVCSRFPELMSSASLSTHLIRVPASLTDTERNFEQSSLVSVEKYANMMNWLNGVGISTNIAII